MFIQYAQRSVDILLANHKAGVADIAGQKRIYTAQVIKEYGRIDTLGMQQVFVHLACNLVAVIADAYKFGVVFKHSNISNAEIVRQFPIFVSFSNFLETDFALNVDELSILACHLHSHIFIQPAGLYLFIMQGYPYFAPVTGSSF